ncbi:MAG: DUF938 domain-containing protein [Pseudomonadota bacterium]
MPAPDNRLNAPAADRNRAPLLEVLKGFLPSRGAVLEIASGTGQHVVFFAAAFPDITWFPSDPSLRHRTSIEAYIAATESSNIHSPQDIDVTQDDWPQGPFDGIICINMIHIAPWEATLGLLRGAGLVLAPNGKLILYGPFRRNGSHTTRSNAAFDHGLRQQDPRWGVRDLEEIQLLAENHGLTGPAIVDMPANNLSVCFTKE